VNIDFGTNSWDLAALLVPPLAALASLPIRRRSALIGVAVLVAVVTWVFEWQAEMWLDARWIELMDRTRDPSPELLRAFSADGASKSAIALFGLPVAAIHTSICFVLVRLAFRFRRTRRSPRRSFG